MTESRQWLENNGWPGADPRDCPSSSKRFDDGAQYRIEIPSTEGPRSFRAVLDEAAKRSVPVHRISQGSGVRSSMPPSSAELWLERESRVRLTQISSP